MTFRNEDIARIETVLDYHVGKDRGEKPQEAVLQILMHRKRRFFIITIMNILALVFFGYWFFSGITALPGWIFWVLAAVFALNLASVAWQKRQIDDAIAYVEAGQPPSPSGP